MNAMLIVSLSLGRELTLSEKNMFLFPRICCICHESDPQALTNCLSCGNTSFCQEHISDKTHKDICSSFALSYTFSLLKIFTDNMKISEIVHVLLDNDPINFIPYLEKMPDLQSMRQFLDKFFNDIIQIRCENLRSDFWDIFISDYFTRPLTLISAINKINNFSEGELIIHIVGADYLELNGICAWEIIFHLISNVEKLKLVLIGPGLGDNEIIEPVICDNCIRRGKIFHVETHNVLYHEFVNETMKKPNLIIGYNLGISEYEDSSVVKDTWELTIQKIAEIKVPFVTTCYTEEEAREDHERICHYLNNPVSYTFFQRNQFSSLRPFRDFETEGVFFQNYYLIIYDNLEKKNN